MKIHIYSLNMDIEAIPINYLPNILKSKNRKIHLFGNKFRTIVEDLNPYYFTKLNTIIVRETVKDIILDEDINNFLQLNTHIPDKT